MARPRRQAKRREDLVAAAQRAMIEHGTGSVRLNQVADQAGITSGAVLYYYPDIKDLLLEANRAGMERFYVLRTKALEGIEDPVERLLVTIRTGLPVDGQDSDVRLLCELGGSAGRNPVYAALLTTLYDRQVSMYEVILEAGAARGCFRLAAGTLTIARNLVALEDAYGYRMVAGHPTINREAAFELILSYARQATGSSLETDPP
jgi:AcrR family transcriptional regulator